MMNKIYLVIFLLSINNVLSQNISLNGSPVFVGMAENNETGQSISIRKFTTENQSDLDFVKGFGQNFPVVGGAIDPFNPTNLYYIWVNWSTQEYSLRVLNLSDNQVDILGILVTTSWAGLEFDSTNGHLYGVSADSLYEIDPINITTNLIGGMGLNVSSLAIDGDGNFFTYDYNDDSLYSIDKNNAQTTLIGQLDVDAISQGGGGMAWDSNTNMIYMTCINSNFDRDFRSIDINTGNTTLIGNLDAGIGIYKKSYHWISFDGSILTNSDFQKNRISIYPNPMKDFINLISSDVISSLTIFNISGKSVFKIKNSIPSQLDISELESGIYFIRIETNYSIETLKIIKE